MTIPPTPPPSTPTPSPPPPPPPTKRFVLPTPGELITSTLTGNTFTMGDRIGEGNFGVVFACKDIWENDLAAKILKPTRTYDEVRASAVRELEKLRTLRHPFITFVHDAFEFRDTFYIITERCYCPISNLFKMENFNGPAWLLPVARSLLQAVHYMHINQFVHQDIHPDNVFASFARNEMMPTQPGGIQFKLGDLGVAMGLAELKIENVRAKWLLPPEVLDHAAYGPLDKRIDLYHIGLLLLQLASSKEMRFSSDDILAGKPRELALTLPQPYSFALEKALRRRTQYRTADAMELWRDLHGPSQAPNPQPTTKTR